MRQRITFIHEPQDAIDPKLMKVGKESLAVSGIKAAAREDRVTLGVNELPEELKLLLEQSHELHLRYVKGHSWDPISPFASRLSPGLHIYYTPQQNSSSFGTLSPFINEFKKEPHVLQSSDSLEDFFTLLPAHRFQHSAAFEYYLPGPELNEDNIYNYIQLLLPSSHPSSSKYLQYLTDAASIDLDFDTISHAVIISILYPPRIWELDIANSGTQDRLEVGILSNERPIELEELSLGGFLTVVGEDIKPSATLFSFPARHHISSLTYGSTFLQPTGLHPTMQLSISGSTPPHKHETCSLHAHLTLPSVIFPDKYQFIDPLFMSSKNLSAIRYVTTPVDLEAPDYAMSLWGSSLLLELSPPLPSSDSWTAEIPMHLRYLKPNSGGVSEAEIPWPVLFWACTAEEGSKFTINPFDRVNLGYDGLFGPRTMFYHLSPDQKVDGAKNGYSTIKVPVLDTSYAKYVESGTAVVIMLGFVWVLWKLSVVWRTAGYKDFRDEKVEKKTQ